MFLQMFLRKYIIRMIILFQCIFTYSQEIYHADYSNKYNSFKNINELKSYRTFIQLTLYGDKKYCIEEQIYFNNELNHKSIVNCFKIKGTWEKNEKKLILTSEGFNNITNFKFASNGEKMFLIEQNSKLNRHIKFKKVFKTIEIFCKEPEKSSEE